MSQGSSSSACQGLLHRPSAARPSPCRCLQSCLALLLRSTQPTQHPEGAALLHGGGDNGGGSGSGDGGSNGGGYQAQDAAAAGSGARPAQDAALQPETSEIALVHLQAALGTGNPKGGGGGGGVPWI